MYSMRAELQNMNNQGSIVNASSIAGLIGFPKHAAYTACKHGWFYPFRSFLTITHIFKLSLDFQKQLQRRSAFTKALIYSANNINRSETKKSE